MNEEQMKYVANLISQDLEKDKKIERLHSIIKEARKETEKQLKGAICQEFTDLKAILRILDKENK